MARTTEPQNPAVGQFVLALPWTNGTRSETAEQGVILGPLATYSKNQIQIIWFPEMGAPTAGESVQAIESGYIFSELKNLNDIPAAQAIEYHRQISQAPIAGEIWERMRSNILPVLEKHLQART